MDKETAIGFIQGKLDCMNKCDLFDRTDSRYKDRCDNCEYCYTQGNFGQQKEAFRTAIELLQEEKNKLKNARVHFDTIDCLHKQIESLLDLIQCCEDGVDIGSIKTAAEMCNTMFDELMIEFEQLEDSIKEGWENK